MLDTIKGRFLGPIFNVSRSISNASILEKYAQSQYLSQNLKLETA